MAHKTMIADRSAVRGAMSLQCKLVARLQLDMAKVLIGKGQDELREHFMESASLLATVAKELES